MRVRARIREFPYPGVALHDGIPGEGEAHSFDPSKYPLAVVSLFHGIVSDLGNRAFCKSKSINFDAV